MMIKKRSWRSIFLSMTLGLAMTTIACQSLASGGDLVDPPQLNAGSSPGDNSNGGANKTVPARRIQGISNRFETSLHATRRGKERFYSAYWDIDGDGNLEDNGGFQHQVTDLYGPDVAAYENLPCKECHYLPAVVSTDTDTDAEVFPGGCTDCHWNYYEEDYGVPAFNVDYCDLNADPLVVEIGYCPESFDPATQISQDGVCIGCHSRQNAEHTLLTDVHRTLDAASPGETPKFGCMGCHHEQEVHGDELMLDSHLDNPKTSCAQSGCHERETRIVAGKKATGGACKGGDGKTNERCETFHVQHMADVDCTSCHIQSNTTCNSCHFDSELNHRKRFYRQIPAVGFKFLMNFPDIQTGVPKVRTANYQSLTVGAVCVDGECETENAKTFVVFAPFASHSVTKGEELKCRDCHVVSDGNGGYEGNPAMVQYLTEGTVTTTKWNPDASVAGMLEGPSGTIPIPHDWAPGQGGALKMDFAYYLGNTEDPVVKDPDGDEWAFLKTGPDGGHMPYGSPLSEEQIQKLILDEFPDE